MQRVPTVPRAQEDNSSVRPRIVHPPPHHVPWVEYAADAVLQLYPFSRIPGDQLQTNTLCAIARGNPAMMRAVNDILNTVLVHWKASHDLDPFSTQTDRYARLVLWLPMLLIETVETASGAMRNGPRLATGERIRLMHEGNTSTITDFLLTQSGSAVRQDGGVQVTPLPQVYCSEEANPLVSDVNGTNPESGTTLIPQPSHSTFKLRKVLANLVN